MSESAQQKLTEAEALRLQLAASERRLDSYERRLSITIGIALFLALLCVIGVRLVGASDLVPASSDSAILLGYIGTALRLGAFAFLITATVAAQLHDNMPAWIRAAVWLIVVGLVAGFAHMTFYQLVLPLATTT